MKRPYIKKRELFHKIFDAKRAREIRFRSRRLESAMGFIPYTTEYANYVVALLNRAAPIAFDLGNGWIECSAFGSIHPELNMLSYRPLRHRADCTALVSGIKLANIKRAKLI